MLALVALLSLTNLDSLVSSLDSIELCTLNASAFDLIYRLTINKLWHTVTSRSEPVRDLDSHTMRLGKIWFVVAGTCAIGLVTALYKTDMFLDAAGFREKSGALLRTVRVAQANLPSSAKADPRTLVASKVGSLGDGEMHGSAHDSHESHGSHGSNHDGAEKTAPIAELVDDPNSAMPEAAALQASPVQH
jgi:hypothetical protein